MFTSRNLSQIHSQSPLLVLKIIMFPHFSFITPPFSQFLPSYTTSFFTWSQFLMVYGGITREQLGTLSTLSIEKMIDNRGQNLPENCDFYHHFPNFFLVIPSFSQLVSIFWCFMFYHPFSQQFSTTSFPTFSPDSFPMLPTRPGDLFARRVSMSLAEKAKRQDHSWKPRMVDIVVVTVNSG